MLYLLLIALAGILLGDLGITGVLRITGTMFAVSASLYWCIDMNQRLANYHLDRLRPDYRPGSTAYSPSRTKLLPPSGDRRDECYCWLLALNIVVKTANLFSS
ncbi:TPA: hypothetical protein ACF7ZB_004548 [Kluyvera georgiana]